jgi:hypothetical protein
MDKRPDNQKYDCPKQDPQPDGNEYADRGGKVIVTAARRFDRSAAVCRRIFGIVNRPDQRLPAQESDQEAVLIGAPPRPAAIEGCSGGTKLIIMSGFVTHQISIVKA